LIKFAYISKSYQTFQEKAKLSVIQFLSNLQNYMDFGVHKRYM